MSWLKRIWRRRQVEAGMGEEMEFHRQARIDDLVRRGMDRAAATRQAALEFGSVATYREECRAELGYRPLDELRADLRFALRGIRRNPGFSAAAVAILALAIGVNGAFFSLHRNYVSKPLPIRGAERHYHLSGFNQNGGSTFGWTAGEVAALRHASRDEMEGLYTATTFEVLVLAPIQRRSLITAASGNYFALLGGTPEQGRVFTPAEEREPMVVLSRAGAARLFPGVASPIGRQVRVRSIMFTVAGVMPPPFAGAEPVIPDFWVPAGMESALRGRPSTAESRAHIYGLLAREGVAERAESALTAAAAHFPRPGAESVARVLLKPRGSLFPSGDGTTEAAAFVFAMFSVVLLIACANLANLYLARAAARTHEIAMRLSLGASRWRIVRQLLTESTLIALLGAAGGYLLVFAAVPAAHDFAISLARIEALNTAPLAVDSAVLLYSMLLGLLAGLAFGLLPALEVTSPSLTRSTKFENAAFAGRIRPRRMRDLLIGAQAAASLVLLILAAVLVRSIPHADSAIAGYDLNRIFDLRLNQASEPMLRRIAEQPGVAAVAAVERVPQYGRLDRLPVTVEGQTAPLGVNRVDPRYFETLELAVHGRAFTAAEASSRARVALISQATAGRLWPGRSALGRTFALQARGEAPPETYEVIGVVPDVASGWLFEGKDSSAIYLPAAAGQPGIEEAIARITGNPAQTVAALRDLCARGADGAGCEPASLSEISAMTRAPFQIAAGTAGALGGLALLLTAIGLYGVASYSVVQRRREIGVHMALGAVPRQVMRRILTEVWRCVALGLAAGLPVCLLLSKLAAGSVFRIRTFDPAAYLMVPALLLLIVAIACAGPALRAARMDPMTALRQE